MGQLALLGGVIIFLLSMGARGILKSALGNLPAVLDEGLIILAWLALWRPAEALVYEWGCPCIESGGYSNDLPASACSCGSMRPRRTDSMLVPRLYTICRLHEDATYLIVHPAGPILLPKV